MNKITLKEFVDNIEDTLVIKPHEYLCQKCKEIQVGFVSTHISSPGGYTMCYDCYGKMIDAQFKAWLEE